MTTHYHAGWNMVGYLPEMDASYPYESWADVKQSMIAAELNTAHRVGRIEAIEAMRAQVLGD